MNKTMNNMTKVVQDSILSMMLVLVGKLASIRSALTICIAIMSTAWLCVASAAEVEQVRRGSFVGASGHDASGTGHLVKTTQGTWEVRLQSDFRMDRAPGPWISLGNNGKYVPGTLIALVKSRRGEQVYEIPSSIDASKYNTIVIWCKPYNVPMGFAKLR